MILGSLNAEDLNALNTTKHRYINPGLEYKIICDKLSFSSKYKVGRNKDTENIVGNRLVTTSLTLSCYPTKNNGVQLGYVLTDEDSFVNTGAPTFDSESVSLSSRYNITRNQSLELRHGLTTGGNAADGTTGSQNQSIHFAYDYRF